MSARLIVLCLVLLMTASLTVAAGASPPIGADGEGRVSAVSVEVSGVYAKYADGRPDHTVLAERRWFDLLELSDSITAVVAGSDLPTGVVDQLRLIVTSGHVVVDDVQHPLTVPGADRSGLKLQGSFDVLADCSPVLTVDSDVVESIIDTMGRGWMFKPVLNLIETAQACDDDENSMLTLPGFQGAWETDSEPMSIHRDGDQPAAWLETSGTFDAARSSNDGPGPRFIEDAVNGLPAMRFTAADEHYFLRPGPAGIPWFDGDAGQTIYLVARHRSSASTGTETLVSSWSSTSLLAQQFNLSRLSTEASPDQLRYQVGTNTGNTTTGVGSEAFPSDVWILITARFKDNTVLVRADGIQAGFGSRSGSMVGGLDGFFVIGALSPTHQHFNGDIAALYVYNEGHEDAVMLETEVALMDKFGLQF